MSNWIMLMIFICIIANNAVWVIYNIKSTNELIDENYRIEMELIDTDYKQRIELINKHYKKLKELARDIDLLRIHLHDVHGYTWDEIEEICKDKGELNE